MPRPSGRRVGQGCAVVVLAGSASMLLLPGAQASGDVTTKPPVLQQAWFWQNAYEQANPPVAQQAPATEPSGVPDGDLAVAYTGNSDKSSSKLTTLSFDVSGAPAGSSISQFAFSLTLDGQPAATSFNVADAAIAACLPTRLWPAQMGADYTNAPSVDCTHKVAPQVNGSTYTFTIPTIAQTWLDDQNLGVAIVVDPGAAAAPFQLVFNGAKSLKADMSYSAPVAPTSQPKAPAGGVAVPAGAVPGAAGAGSSGAPVALPPATTANTAAAPAPVVAPMPGAGARAATTPASVDSATSAPTKGFWAAALVLAAVVLAASLVLGDPAPAAATARPTRLARVLRERNLLTARSL